MSNIKISPETGKFTMPTDVKNKLIKVGWNIEDTRIYSPKYEHVIIEKIETEYRLVIHYVLLNINYLNKHEMLRYSTSKDIDGEIVSPEEMNEERNKFINKIEKLTEIAKNNNMMIKGTSDKIIIYDKDKRAIIGINESIKIQCKSERGTWVLLKRLYKGYYLSNRFDDRKTTEECERELTTELQAVKPIKLLTKDILPDPRQFIDINYIDKNIVQSLVKHDGKIWHVNVQKISHLQDDCIFYDEITDPNCDDLWFICLITCHSQHNNNFKIAYRPDKEGWHMLYRTGRDRITTEGIAELNKYDEMLIKKAT